jgi:UDP-N-acetylmuramoyl-tripeptide--D-alanyl-D-alanine ligase
MSAADLANAMAGRILNAPEGWRSGPIRTDTRTLESGATFLALKGPNFDGHDFLEQAILKGATGIIVESGVIKPDTLPRGVMAIEVDDTLVALGRLARAVRKASGIRVVAITGSSGKTTTKSFVSSILARSFRVVSTEGNFNNLIGLPLSILSVKVGDQAGVFELGTNHPGEIARLADLCLPDAGIITNIGAAHLAGLGDERGVFEEKTALLRALRQDGLALLPAADRWLPGMLERVDGDVCRVGHDPQADFYWETEGRKQGGWQASFHDRRTGWKGHGEVPGLAQHNVQAAGFGVALAMRWGADPETALQGLQDVRIPAMRMEYRLINGVEWVIDCYNANPSSMRSALDVIRGMDTTGRKVVVIGDMLELGEQTRRYHEVLASWVAASGFDAVFACGEEIRTTVSSLQAMGWNRGPLVHREKVSDLKEELFKYLQAGDLLLIKASRVIGLDQLLPEIHLSCSST